MSSAPEACHRDGWSLPSATGNARGLYNPLQFVVRLHPDLHEQLQGLPPGVNPPRSFGATQALALSTYYHETIHWWQHVGSTLGLFLSLAYPAQTHINYAYLKKVLEVIGPVKSLKTFQVAPPRSITNEAEQQLNIVLNNWHDIEFCRWLALLPEYARTYLRDRYFECIGHSFHIAWASALQLVGGAADPTHSFLPDPRAWDEPFLRLRDERVRDYYYRSPLFLPPLGARAIFEGQARFCQLQLLHFGSGGRQDWAAFEHAGMLVSDYTAAFELYLEVTELPWPGSVGDPEVALFLAICDMAINPTEGFPYDITNFAKFRENTDPGVRFMKLCQAVKEKVRLTRLITGFTRDEYLEATQTLAEHLRWQAPLDACARIESWREHPSMAQLMEEDQAFRFTNRDLPVRLFSSRFFAFQQDKLRYPQVLVWPGA